MKKMSKILALVMTLAMLLCLCACGDTGEGFETRMTAASEQMSKLDSMHMDMDMALSVELSVMGQSQTMDMSVNYKMDISSGKAKADMSVTTMGVSQTVLIYTEQVDGVTTGYVSQDGGNSWQKSTNANEIQVPQDPSQALGLFMQNAKSFKKTGEEVINGSTATVYSGTLSREYMEEILKTSGMDSALSGMADEELLNTMLSELKDVPVTVAIDNNTGYVVRYTMDMTDLMRTMMTNVMKMALEQNGLGGVEVKVTVSNAVATMTFSQFNAVGEIVIPEAAKNA